MCAFLNPITAHAFHRGLQASATAASASKHWTEAEARATELADTAVRLEEEALALEQTGDKEQVRRCGAVSAGPNLVEDQVTASLGIPLHLG